MLQKHYPNKNENDLRQEAKKLSSYFFNVQKKQSNYCYLSDCACCVRLRGKCFYRSYAENDEWAQDEPRCGGCSIQ